MKEEKIIRKDYEKLGLKAGIEVHQQLDTSKLFCKCPSILRDDKPDFIVKRELRASAGETNEIDIAALHEIKKEKYVLYEGYYDTTCLVELDEEPPHKMNKGALEIVLEVSKIVKAKIVDEIQVMRKTVVDGSNTSGFQRTALVALDGVLKLKNKKITIPLICIEEEAAKIISKQKEYQIYRLDRLGIPLIEISTGPDLKSPDEVKEAAEKIGMILRSTGKVKRGIGTIRQDINVSIKEGARIEIKGAQDLKLIPLYVESEVKRQANLLELKKELKKRGLKKISSEIIDVTEFMKDVKAEFIEKAIKSSEKAFAIKIEKFEGMIKKEEIKNQRLGYEFGTYAKMLGLGGIIHSDEDYKKIYGFNEEKVKELEKKLKVKKGDSWIVCIGDSKKIETLFNYYIIERVNKAIKEIPKEVRQANPDGTSKFMRPMPGGARMYPETDIYPIKPNVKEIKSIELIEKKLERIKKLNISNDLAKLIAKSGRADEFEIYVKKFKNLKASFIGEIMIPKMIELKRKENANVEKIKENDLDNIFELSNKGEIAKASVETLLLGLTKGKQIQDIIKEKELKLISEKELVEKIKEIISKNKNIEQKYLVGKLMHELKGKAEPSKIMGVLKKLR